MGRSYKKKPRKLYNFKKRDMYMKSDSLSVVSWYDSKTHKWIRYATEEERKEF